MKKRILSFLLTFCLSMALLSTNAFAAWSSNYTPPTGNQAQDIVNVAVAQDGKNGPDLNYYNNVQWCAYFVYDCAKRANVNSIPYEGVASSMFRKSTQNGLEGNYFTDVTSQNSTWTGGHGGGMQRNYDTQYCSGMHSSNWTPQMGDIVFFTYKGYTTISHVGIVQYASGNTIYVVHGNWGSKVVKDYKMTRGQYRISDREYAICAYVRPNYSGQSQTPTPPAIQPQHFNCNVRIECINGWAVNLYNNPGDASRADYFSLGQTVSSTYGMARSDGSTWYQITANQNGTPKTFWLKYESGKMTVTNLMSKGPYTLIPKCAPGSCLDVKGGSSKDETNVRIYTANSTTAQQWELTYLNNGYYKITSRASGKALDVAGASTEAGANVQQYTSNGTNAQQWMLKDAEDGYYYIVPRVNTTLCLDVAGSGTADGTNVGIYTANGTDAQKWKLMAPEISYTVTFNPNGGSVSTSSKQVISGSQYGTLPTPIRSGYIFDGWYTSINGSIRMTSNTIANLTSNQTLYAHWTKDKHTHTNGAYFYSDDHPHYKFYTCTTCGEVYTDGSTTNMSSCSVCNPNPNPNTYTVTFNPNGGECSVDTMQTNADGKLSSLPVATRSNCTFGGWRMIVGGSEPWRAVDTNTVFTKDTSVHAFWIYEPCTVFFDANGGTVSQSSKIVTAGTLYGDLPTPTRSGYKFDGWYTQASGGIRMTSNTGVESTVDHTLYAHWSDDPTSTTWSAWSAWSSTPYIASSTRQVETQQVKVSDAYTEYRYGRYVDGTGRNAGFCTTTLTNLGYSGITVQYSAWTTSQYPAKEKDWTCGFCSGSHTGVHHYSNDGRAWWKEYVSPQSGSFFWEESRQTDAVYETQYRYRDLISG